MGPTKANHAAARIPIAARVVRRVPLAADPPGAGRGRCDPLTCSTVLGSGMGCTNGGRTRGGSWREPGRRGVGASWTGDAASIRLLAGVFAHRAGGIARVSLASYYSSFLFDLATRWLPLHRLVWEGLSLGASLVGIALMAWAAGRAAGKPAAV